MKVLITGIAGFIGSHMVRYLLDNTDWDIIGIDILSYVSKGWSRLKELGCYESPRVRYFTWNLEHEISEGLMKEIGHVDIIIHMAAETHVDTSISNPIHCIKNNVLSTVNILEFARTLPNLKFFQYFSTDEVFGPAPAGTNFKESDRHNPTNPYSASKSASESICISYQNTFGIPLVISNLMNAYGITQYKEKFIPKIISKLLKSEEIIIHTEADGITPGSRFYIHVSNICSATLFILKNGTIGEKYNIRGEKEVSNLELATKIASILNIDLKYKLMAVHDDRPNHDTRYALDGTKLSSLGWKHENDFDDLLKETVLWTITNQSWLE